MVQIEINDILKTIISISISGGVLVGIVKLWYKIIKRDVDITTYQTNTDKSLTNILECESKLVEKTILYDKEIEIMNLKILHLEEEIAEIKDKYEQK